MDAQSPGKQRSALTPRQKLVYDFIVHYRRANGCSPSIPEIQREFGIRSPNGVVGHLRALISKGFVRRAERGSRQIDVIAPPTLGESQDLAAAALCAVPLYGQIAAGYPEFVNGSGSDATIRIDEQTLGFHPKPGTFALRVRGDSMIGAGIFEGDMVIVEPNPSPRANQVVVALIDGESTLKRLVRVKGKWFLKAENPNYPELHPRADLVIQGSVRAVIRRLD